VENQTSTLESILDHRPSSDEWFEESDLDWLLGLPKSEWNIREHDLLFVHGNMATAVIWHYLAINAQIWMLSLLWIWKKAIGIAVSIQEQTMLWTERWKNGSTHLSMQWQLSKHANQMVRNWERWINFTYWARCSIECGSKPDCICDSNLHFRRRTIHSWFRLIYRSIAPSDGIHSNTISFSKHTKWLAWDQCNQKKRRNRTIEIPNKKARCHCDRMLGLTFHANVRNLCIPIGGSLGRTLVLVAPLAVLLSEQ
jgi:hypothetical protein